MDNILEELQKELELTYQHMGRVSDTIRKFEESLREARLHLPFSIYLDDTGSQMVWDKVGDNYHLSFVDGNVLTPLSNAKFPIKYKCYLSLIKFMKELTSYLRTAREEIIASGLV